MNENNIENSNVEAFKILWVNSLPMPVSRLANDFSNFFTHKKTTTSWDNISSIMNTDIMS